MVYKGFCITTIRDCAENEGGYYCEIYDEADEYYDNQLDNFCIHIDELQQNNNEEYWIKQYIDDNYHYYCTNLSDDTEMEL